MPSSSSSSSPPVPPGVIPPPVSSAPAGSSTPVVAVVFAPALSSLVPGYLARNHRFQSHSSRVTARHSRDTDESAGRERLSRWRKIRDSNVSGRGMPTAGAARPTKEASPSVPSILNDAVAAAAPDISMVRERDSARSRWLFAHTCLRVGWGLRGMLIHGSLRRRHQWIERSRAARTARVESASCGVAAGQRVREGGERARMCLFTRARVLTRRRWQGVRALATRPKSAVGARATCGGRVDAHTCTASTHARQHDCAVRLQVTQKSDTPCGLSVYGSHFAS